MELTLRDDTAGTDGADSAIAVSRALALLSERDLLKLQALARLRARVLPPGMAWSDLLHEALVRALEGSRQWPQGVPLLVFLAGVMRSIADEIWRHRRHEAALTVFGRDSETDGLNVPCPAADPERVLVAVQAIAHIYKLFAGDAVALRIISGLANGLSAEEIRLTHGITATAYDSARRRMRRTLLRAGLIGAGLVGEAP